ncbi:MAG TPA: C25 family cysteine peptidase, partial [Anaerolineales bacterium]|nr:C25 family cysteine peptidase [Anaerolineales bacterium]
DFPSEVARRLDQGAVLATYIGHGSSDWLGPALAEDGWYGPVFTQSDLPSVNDAHASLVMMIACSAGEYDQSRSLAEELLLKPGGAVATYAASRLTLPAANTILGKDLFRILLAGQARTAGEWIRLAESNYKNPGSDQALSLWLLTRAVPQAYELAIWGNGDETPPLDEELVYGLQQHAYNLFGDPALTLAVPRPELNVRPDWGWLPFGKSVAFSGEGKGLMDGQIVTVTLYTRQSNLLPRAEPAKDLATRYQNANDKTVAQANVIVNAEGKYLGALSLPSGLPSGRYILEAVTVNNNATLVGAHAVYVGWPPVAELFGSTGFWWLVVSASLGWQYRRQR